MKVYIELRDWWIGYYRGDRHHYVCLLPCIVIRWSRGHRRTESILARVLSSDGANGE